MASPILVATCGNPMASGDALGARVADLLRRQPLPETQVVSVDTDPAMLLDYLPCHALLVVDAITSPDHRAGTVLDLDPFDSLIDEPRRPKGEAPAELRLSMDARLGGSLALPVGSHSLSVLQDLYLARKLGLLPRIVRVVGLVIDAPDASLGADLPDVVSQAARRVALRVQRRVRQILAVRQLSRSRRRS